MTKEKPISESLVCVTGGSGFIASHVVRELLERGYRVRTTVRDLAATDKSDHLRQLSEDIGQPLEIVEADLLVADSFDEAFKDCDYVCHVAAVAKLSAANPEQSIVAPSVEGTRNVLKSVVKAGTITRYVHTSSVAAVSPTGHHSDQIFNEDSWNDNATLKNNPYGLAKTKAEKLLWSFIEQLPEDKRFEAVSINPVLVAGPVYNQRHTRASPMVVRDLLVGAFPACRQFSFGIVDVREVAWAHAEAMTHKSPSKRYILCNESRWMVEISRTLAELYPHCKIPTSKLPNFLMYLLAIFDKRLSFANLRNLLGQATKFDNSRSVNELEVKYRPIRETLKDCCDSMIEKQLAKPRLRAL